MSIRPIIISIDASNSMDMVMVSINRIVGIALVIVTVVKI